MRIKVKLVVFKHPKPETWRTYASYCPAIKDYCGRGSTVKEVIDMETRILLDDLKYRLKYNTAQPARQQPIVVCADILYNIRVWHILPMSATKLLCTITNE